MIYHLCALGRRLLCSRGWHLAREVQTGKYDCLNCWLCAYNVATKRAPLIDKYVEDFPY